MPDVSQKKRLIRILELLSSGKAVSAAVLKKEFGDSVTVRTLQRDLQDIADILPLDNRTVRGREQEFVLPRYYRGMILPVIHQNEMLAFHYLKSFIKTLKTSAIAKDIEALEKKLETLVPGDVILPSTCTDEELVYDQNKGYFDYSDYDHILNRVIQAIGDKAWIDMDYFPVDADKSRTLTIFPHRIYTYRGSLYMLATVYHYEKPVSFLVHYIKAISKSEKKTGTRPSFSPEDFTVSRFGVFSGEPEHVKINISKDIRRHFIGRIWHESQTLTENHDGSLTLTLDVPIVPDFISWILSWGVGMKVLEPEGLVKKMREIGKELCKLY
ncbi:helix-turn-helix transcriptional regulator [Fidelibacter multiformis]|uniref:helix-turn-helix transcriptional regulator n=1 Tax=Fidelibacter multiformis TaxID=3377529 RepID=UPI0037DCA1A9